MTCAAITSKCETFKTKKDVTINVDRSLLRQHRQAVLEEIAFQLDRLGVEKVVIHIGD